MSSEAGRDRVEPHRRGVGAAVLPADHLQLPGAKVSRPFRDAMSMRYRHLLMVYPEFPKTYWGMQYFLPLIGKKALMPPLGLITIAALTPQPLCDPPGRP